MESQRSRRFIRYAVYGMLVISAGVAFLLNDRLWIAARLGNVPTWFPLVSPCAFTLFVLVFTFDRWLLIRRERYPVSKAIFHIALAVIFLSFLWPGQAAEFRSMSAHPDRGAATSRLLRHMDPSVRAAACELASKDMGSAVRQEVKVLAEEDDSARVRDSCARALKDMDR